MKKIQWGINDRKITTGADLYVLIFQITSLIPLPFMLAVTGYPAVMTSDNVLTFLFKTGIMALPRTEALALSFAYRALASEMVVYFAMPVIAFVLGILFKRLLKGSFRASRVLRIILLILIGCDLIFRMLPFSFNYSFGIAPAVIGFLIRLACLILIILDLRCSRYQEQVS